VVLNVRPRILPSSLGYPSVMTGAKDLPNDMHSVDVAWLEARLEECKDLLRYLIEH
jgi:hypothetical protein